jgi:hypothetical protein
VERLAEQQAQQERLSLRIIDTSTLETFTRKMVDNALEAEHVDRVEAEQASEARMRSKYEEMKDSVGAAIKSVLDGNMVGWENIHDSLARVQGEAREARDKARSLTERMDTVESLATELERANIQENGQRLKLEKRVEQQGQSITTLREDLENIDARIKASVNDMRLENKQEFGSVNARLDALQSSVSDILGAIQTGQSILRQPPPPNYPPPASPPPQPTFFEPHGMEELGMLFQPLQFPFTDSFFEAAQSMNSARDLSGGAFDPHTPFHTSTALSMSEIILSGAYKEGGQTVSGLLRGAGGSPSFTRLGASPPSSPRSNPEESSDNDHEMGGTPDHSPPSKPAVSLPAENGPSPNWPDDLRMSDQEIEDELTLPDVEELDEIEDVMLPEVEDLDVGEDVDVDMPSVDEVDDIEDDIELPEVDDVELDYGNASDGDEED